MIAEQLVGKSFFERCVLKAAAFSALALPLSIKQGAVTVTVTRLERVGDLLHVVLAAEKAGTALQFDGDLWVKNPPILVPDGVGYREDPLEALKQIVLQTARMKKVV